MAPGHGATISIAMFRRAAMRLQFWMTDHERQIERALMATRRVRVALEALSRLLR